MIKWPLWGGGGGRKCLLNLSWLQILGYKIYNPDNPSSPKQLAGGKTDQEEEMANLFYKDAVASLSYLLAATHL